MNPAIIQLIVLGIVLLVFFLIGLFLILKRAYNITGDIYEQTAGGIKCYKKLLKKSEKLEGNRLVFFLSKTIIPLPTSKYFFMTGKNTYKINLYKDKNGNYQPIPLLFTEGENSPLLKPDDSDMRFWKTVMDKEADLAYAKDGFWEKYGGIITLSVLCVTALVILIVYGYYYFNGFQTGMAEATGQLGQLNNVLGKALGVTG